MRYLVLLWWCLLMALDPTFQSALDRLIADAPGSVSITSGFRDPERQQELWAEALDKYGDPEVADNWVARPGGSRHEWGAAADLAFESDAVRQWVHQNAPRYGLHFPLDNEDWHIEKMAEGGGRLSSREQVGGGGAPMVATGGSGAATAGQTDDRSLLVGVLESMSRWVSEQAMTGTDADGNPLTPEQTDDPEPEGASEASEMDVQAASLAPVVEAPEGTLERQAEAFLAALREHESGNQNVPNRGGHSSASGFYQFVDSTWGGYGGYARAMDAPFAVQHARAKEDVVRAFRAYGNWEDVAVWWLYPKFAGQRNMWHLVPGAERGRPHSGNPTAQEYVDGVMALMRQVGG